MSKFINEDRLFQKIKYFFARPEMVYIEIAQNSTRAGATSLDLSLVDNTLTAIDNGSGCTDPMALLQLSGSDWSEEIESEQNPAGWGLFALYAISSTVKFASNFGSLTVNCKRFLEDTEYRENLPKSVEKSERCDGFAIRAEIADKDILNSLNSGCKDDLEWFPLELSFNGDKIERMEADKLYGDYPIITEYEGNKVYIDPQKISVIRHDISDMDITVIWHGHIIKPKWYSWDAIVIDVKKGSPLTPVLPYRNTIRKDEKESAFREFVRKRVVEYCTIVINTSNGDNKDMLEKIVNRMSYLANQEELDALNRYGIEKSDCYYNDEYDCSNAEFIPISKGQQVPVNECLENIVINGTDYREAEHSSVTLPPNTVTSISKYRGSPSWLNVETKYVNLEIETEGEPIYVDNNTWTKAKSIRCGGKELEVAYVDDEFFFAKPEAIYEIDHAVFAMHVFYEDGDSWDTQLDYYNETVRNAMNKIRGSYKKHDLFRSLYDAGLNGNTIENITEIKINKKEVIIKTNGGDSIKLKLAA